MSADPYTDPNTGLLKNKLGLIRSDDLEQAERDITRAALLRIHDRRVQGGYVLEHLRAFHRAIFRDIYEWAGEIRTVAIAKGEVFCLPQFIESAAAELFTRLAKEDHLRGLDRAGFVERIAYYFGEINGLDLKADKPQTYTRAGRWTISSTGSVMTRFPRRSRPPGWTSRWPTGAWGTRTSTA